ncbi:MAG TPA: DNA primase [Patescibacteria group bacterium]|nr:DNA primase [Patescibacteria group bacterium]
MDDIEKVKQKLDIVDVIGSYIQLKKAGRNFKSNCPFHDEKSASFVVSPDRQIWHCFGCQKGGDVFTFVEEYENIGFGEALKELAMRAGIKLSAPAARTEREKKQESIYSLNHLTSQFYNYLLLSHPVGKKALDYLLNERKMSIPLIKTFNLGFAPDNDALVKYLIGKKKYTEDEVLNAGLGFRRGRYVSDFFRSRIIFPIIDARGNVIAFSGRGLNAETQPKYVNTRETPVYVKGDTLFGINLARDGIKKEGKVIIVEGEFDVITAHKEGITNIVAVKGTALTENQIKLLKRFAPKFVFCFDTDKAGTEAQRRSIQLIEHEGITATVIIPPLGKDPDELLNENAPAFKKAMRDDINVYDFIIDSAIKESDKASAEGMKKILDRTLPYLAAIENEVIKEHYLKKLAEKLDVSLDSVTRQAQKSTKPEPKKVVSDINRQLTKEEKIETYLLSLIFQSPRPKEFLVTAKTVLDGIGLTNPSYEKVLKKLEDYTQTSTTFDASHFASYLPSELKMAFDTASIAPIADFNSDEKLKTEIEKIAKQAKTTSVRAKLKKLGTLIGEAEKEKDSQKVEELETEFNKYSKLLS